MRTATTVELSAGASAVVEFVVEAEKLGLDACWVAEAWGADAPSALGYLAARTQRMQLGSGVMQVGTRSPVLIAQTAITLSNLSSGRYDDLFNQYAIEAAKGLLVKSLGITPAD